MRPIKDPKFAQFTKVRRNYFIERRQLPMLEKAAKKKKVSQGEIVRRALDAYLVGS